MAFLLLFAKSIFSVRWFMWTLFIWGGLSFLVIFFTKEGQSVAELFTVLSLTLTGSAGMGAANFPTNPDKRIRDRAPHWVGLSTALALVSTVMFWLVYV